MLHNFGTVVLAMEMPKVFRRIAVVAQSTNRPDFVVAREMVGMDHFEIGGIVAEKWKLESSIATLSDPSLQDTLERTHLMDVLWLSSKLVGELRQFIGTPRHSTNDSAERSHSGLTLSQRILSH